MDLQALHDELEQSEPALIAEWDKRVAAAVNEIATFLPPFDPAEDAWHAPTSAVWHAAWVAVLAQVYSAAARPLPEAVAEQLRWFALGRWPSAYADLSEGAPRRYLVL